MRTLYQCCRYFTTTLTEAPKWLVVCCLCAPMAAFSQNTSTDNSQDSDSEQTSADQADTSGQSGASESESESKFNLRQTTPAKPRINSRQAAVIAKQHAGGKVLRVHATSSGHRIKMLLPSGKVTYIAVDLEGKIQ